MTSLICEKHPCQKANKKTCPSWAGLFIY